MDFDKQNTLAMSNERSRLILNGNSMFLKLWTVKKFLPLSKKKIDSCRLVDKTLLILFWKKLSRQNERAKNSNIYAGDFWA